MSTNRTKRAPIHVLGGFTRPERLLLPHEPELVKAEVRRLAETQAVNAEIFGEAMDQSSESFHDNAPAEVIRDGQERIVDWARMYNRLLADHVVVGYPDPESNEVQLGSRVTVSINKMAGFMVDIVGFVRPDVDQDGDIVTSNHESPIVKAVMGLGVGDVGSLEGNPPRPVEILAIDQTAIAQMYASETEARV